MTGRSGSTLIINLLRQDPRIEMLGEIFAYKDSAEQQTLLSGFFDGKLPSGKSVSRETRVLGLKTKLADIDDPDHLAAQIKHHRPIVVLNRRHNYLKQAISYARMIALKEQLKTRHGRSYSNARSADDVVGKIEVDASAIQGWCKQFEELDHQLVSFANRLALGCTTLSYEEFSSDVDAVARKFERILGFSPCIPNKDVVFKNTPEDLREAITNYEDLATSIKGTKYEALLTSQ
jgi:LPS sulfotransferase NodH